MGIFVHNAIFFCDKFEAVSSLAFVGYWPINAFRTQGARHAHDIEHIPLAAAVFPLPFVRIVKIAPETIAHMFVVKANRIITNRDCVWREDFFCNVFAEFGFRQAVELRALRRDAGDHDGTRTRQGIVGEFNEQIYGLADRLKIHVCALASKLHDAVSARAESRSF